MATVKLELTRTTIKIIPESDADIAFIEDTIGLKQDYHYVYLVRMPGNRLVYPIYLQAPRTYGDEKTVCDDR